MVLSSEKKWQLLEALYQYGTDLQELKKALPDWNTDEISITIKRYRRRAQKRVENRVRKQTGAHSEAEKQWLQLDKWYNITRRLHRIQGTSDQIRKRGRQPMNHQIRDHSPLLSKVMACIASLEDHPLPANPSQPNYTQIYKYLSQALGGMEPTELDPASAAWVAEAMRRVKQVAKEAVDSGEYVAHLAHLPDEALQKRHKKKSGASGYDNGTSSERADAEGSDCPLFQDPEDEEEESQAEKVGEGGSSQDLSPDDPYFEIKREMLIKKVSSVQEKCAAELTKLRGLDPYLIPPSLLVKPSSTLINPSVPLLTPSIPPSSTLHR